MNLTEFLEARIGEVEAPAKAEVKLVAKVYDGSGFTIAYQWSRLTEQVSGGWGSSFAPGAPTPQQVLAECEAKRRIVALHQHFPQWLGKTISGDTEFGCDICSRVDDDPGWTHTGGWCETLRAVALPYKDHPGFDQTWS